MKNITQEDKDRLKAIYQAVKKLEPMSKNVGEFERLFNTALIIAGKYGEDEDHALYISLQQTKKEYLIPLTTTSGYARHNMIEQMKLFFLGDLLGWM